MAWVNNNFYLKDIVKLNKIVLFFHIKTNQVNSWGSEISNTPTGLQEPYKNNKQPEDSRLQNACAEKR